MKIHLTVDRIRRPLALVLIAGQAVMRCWPDRKDLFVERG